MAYDNLVALLSNRSRVGLTEELAEKLHIKGEEAVRGALLSMAEGSRGPLGIYLLAVYVVDDTDFWSDGEIYWWSVPALVRKDGTVSWSATHGLPAGAAPHRCGSLEWMTNISMKDPPLLAVVPPDDGVTACALRLGIYDDDGAVADFPRAMTAGYEALSGCKPDGLKGAESILAPVRDAIFKSLKAHEDDILIDEDVTIRRGEDTSYGCGLIASIMNAKVRVYYLVKDELRTVTAGPLQLHKGQIETLKFDGPVAAGGRVAIFARGAEIACSAFGDLTTDAPFLGRILDSKTAALLEKGVSISAKGAAKVVAFYTPPG
jgi:hypothetical protein